MSRGIYLGRTVSGGGGGEAFWGVAKGIVCNAASRVPVPVP